MDGKTDPPDRIPFRSSTFFSELFSVSWSSPFFRVLLGARARACGCCGCGWCDFYLVCRYISCFLSHGQVGSKDALARSMMLCLGRCPPVDDVVLTDTSQYLFWLFRGPKSPAQIFLQGQQAFSKQFYISQRSPNLIKYVFFLRGATGRRACAFEADAVPK